MKMNKFLGISIASIVVISILILPVIQSNVQAHDIGPNYQEDTKIINEVTKATVFFEQYDKDTQSLVKQPIRDISVEKAYELRNILIKLQDQYTSPRERIHAQIDILQDWELIPDDVSLEEIEETLPFSHRPINMRDQPTQQSGVVPNVIVCGPAVTSFITVGGPLLPLHTFLFGILPPFWYNSTQFEFDAFTGTQVAMFLGALPIVAFYCTATTLINAYGAVIGEHTVISPFMALMVLHAGFGLSVNVFDDEFPVNIFDWSIGVSATGLIAYIQVI